MERLTSDLTGAQMKERVEKALPLLPDLNPKCLDVPTDDEIAFAHGPDAVGVLYGDWWIIVCYRDHHGTVAQKTPVTRFQAIRVFPDGGEMDVADGLHSVEEALFELWAHLMRDVFLNKLSDQAQYEAWKEEQADGLEH
jgi:hypothetical protein